MAKITYKSLYTLVEQEIQKAQRFNTTSSYGDQLNRTNISDPVSSAPNAGSMSSLGDLITAIQDVLEYAAPPRIFTGLNVSAISPYPTNQVTITAGKGTVAGRLYELDSDVTMTIPLDDDIIYINLHNDAIKVEKSAHPEKLTIAKIVVPNPGVSNRIINTKDETWDAYIINQRTYDILGDANGHFEEDTINLLRDNIGEILADNLIGNIRLSENLKITNTHGTLELNSDSLKLLDPDGDTTLAKFNRYGTYFYDDNGIEVAKFTVDGARIGNIEVTKNTINSTNFVSGTSGFRITDEGYAEFEDVRIRGVMTSSVFEYSTVSAVGGILFVANSASLVDDMDNTDSCSLHLDQSLFAVGDTLLIKDGTNEEYMWITDISTAPIYQVTRDRKGTYPSNQNPRWKKGTAITSTGNIGTGYIKLDSTSAYSPYMDIVVRDNNDWNGITTKVRLGNLAGITDSELGTLSGYGLYSDNVYLKGVLIADQIKTAITGSRIYMDTTKLIAYDDIDVKLFQIYMEDVSGEGDYGDIILGDYDGGQGFWWDYSMGTFYIRGILDASDITVGNMSVKYLTSGRMVGAECVLDNATSFESDNFEEISGGGSSQVGWQLRGDGVVQMTLDYISGISPDSFIQSSNYSYKISGWRFCGEGYADLHSDNYDSGISGWRLSHDGTIDFTNLININTLNDVEVPSAGWQDGDVLAYSGGVWTSGSGVPRGAILPWSTSTPPTGWLICDGKTVGKVGSGADYEGEEYKNLYDLIKGTYGGIWNWSGGDTILLPNLKGKVPVGYDSTQTEFDSLGEAGGAKTHTLSTDEIPSHTHSVTWYGGSAGAGSYGGIQTAFGSYNTGAAGGGSAHNNLQPYLTILYIIKY